MSPANTFFLMFPRIQLKIVRHSHPRLVLPYKYFFFVIPRLTFVRQIDQILHCQMQKKNQKYKFFHSKLFFSSHSSSWKH